MGGKVRVGLRGAVRAQHDHRQRVGAGTIVIDFGHHWVEVAGRGRGVDHPGVGAHAAVVVALLAVVTLKLAPDIVVEAQVRVRQGAPAGVRALQIQLVSRARLQFHFEPVVVADRPDVARYCAAHLDLAGGGVVVGKVVARHGHRVGLRRGAVRGRHLHLDDGVAHRQRHLEVVLHVVRVVELVVVRV